MEIEKLKEEIKKIQEPRRTEYGNIRHKLEDMILNKVVHTLTRESTWRRMVTFCKRKYPNVDDKVILNLVAETFPIVVYAKQLG